MLEFFEWVFGSFWRWLGITIWLYALTAMAGLITWRRPRD